MKIKLKTLSPIHIGSGEEISPIEYLVDTKFIRIDMDGLFNDSEFKPLMEKFISSAASQRYIGNLLSLDLLKRHPLYNLPLRGEAKSYFKTNQTVVKSFIKTAGRVFIPGSSVKGSLLSAILWAVLKKKYQEKPLIKRKVHGREVKVPYETFIKDILRTGRGYQELLDFVFAQFVKGPAKNRFDSWLAVFDSNFYSPEEVLEISLARVKGGQARDLPLLYETLKPGIEFELEVKTQKSELKVEQIFEIADHFYRQVQKRTKGSLVSKEKLLRIGQGSTAYSTSLLILAEDLGIHNYRVRPPRTKKLIDEIDPLGWVEVRNA